MNQTHVTTLTVPSWVRPATAFTVPLSTWHCLRYSLDTSYCIPFRTLNITHSWVFLVNHNISTQQWISRNLFTFGPMLIGNFLLKWGWGIPRKSLWHRFWDTLYNQKICVTYMVRTQLHILTQISTLGIQLHVSTLYIGNRQVYRKPNKQLYNICLGYCGGGNEISSYISGWHGSPQSPNNFCWTL
jgi:hypothetical protein